jgi:hypothetical protein
MKYEILSKFHIFYFGFGLEFAFGAKIDENFDSFKAKF